MAANDRQVGGSHYRSPIQHWDYVWANNLDYFQGQITKYVTRWREKNGLQDLLKARHFLDKYIELVGGDGKLQDPELTMSLSIQREEREEGLLPLGHGCGCGGDNSDLSLSHPVDQLKVRNGTD